jgi:hypothetical protein
VAAPATAGLSAAAASVTAVTARTLLGTNLLLRWGTERGQPT